jgi:single-strand DNA-binding protein
MNKVVLVGRLTKDPEVRYSQGDNANTVANYTVAVDRRFKSKREGEPTADFINCVVWGRDAEFAEKYFTKGMRIAISGRIQTRNYTNKEGIRVYVTEVVVEEHEFAQSKGENMPGGSFEQATPAPTGDAGDGFMNIPEGIEEELPFN